MKYYIHGYQSSPQSTKGQLLKKELNVKPIKYRDCLPEKLEIKKCIKNIQKNIQQDPKPILIGSSLGGLLSAKAALQNKKISQLILLNPATIPPETDLNTIQNMPKRILKNMQDPQLFNKKIKANIFIIAGTKDQVVPTHWKTQFAQAQQATIKFLKDNHRLSQKINQLPTMIQNIINNKTV